MFTIRIHNSWCQLDAFQFQYLIIIFYLDYSGGNFTIPGYYAWHDDFQSDFSVLKADDEIKVRRRIFPFKTL